MYGLSEMLTWTMVIPIMITIERIFGGHGSVDGDKARNRKGYQGGYGQAVG